MYLYVKNTNEAEYQSLISKREKIGKDYYDDPSAFS